MPRKDRKPKVGSRAGRKPKLRNRPDRLELLRRCLAADANISAIARENRVHRDTLANFVDEMVPPFVQDMLHRAGNGGLVAAQIEALEELNDVASKMKLYFDAADRWLRDPDDPTRYSLSPRETEILVIWELEVEGDNGKPRTIKRKELLTDILKRCGEKGGPTVEEIRVVEINAGNPRKLFLDGVTAGKPLYELIGKAKGQIKSDPAVTLQVFLGSPDWQATQAVLVEAVREHPEVAEKVAAALEAVGKVER